MKFPRLFPLRIPAAQRLELELAAHQRVDQPVLPYIHASAPPKHFDHELLLRKQEPWQIRSLFPPMCTN